MSIAKWGSLSATVQGARYSHTLGVQPGTGSFGIAQYDNTIPRKSTLTMEDDYGGSITLPNCIASDYTPKHNGSDGTFTFSDRRAFWSYLEPVLISYNDTASAVAGLILDSMGESGYDKSSVPSTDYKVSYDQPTNPAQMLADLCDETGCAVYYDITTDKIKILSPDNNIEDLSGFENLKPDYSITGKGGILPQSCVAVAGYDIKQVELTDLEPVYLDADGELVVGEEIKGDDPETGLIKTVNSIYNVSSGMTDDAIKNMKRTAMKWFRIPETVDEYDRKDILPLLNEISAFIVGEGIEEDDEKPDSPYMIGTVASKTGIFNNVEGRIDGGYSFDLQSGIVKFNRPQFKKADTDAGWAAPDLKMVAAYADPLIGYKSAPVSTGRDKTTIGIEYVSIPDIHERYIDGVSENKDDLDEYCQAYLENYVLKYKLQNAGQATCVGLQVPSIPAINLAVEYSVDQTGALTKIGLDRAASPKALSYKMYKSMNKRAKASANTGGRKQDAASNNQKTKKSAVTKDNSSEGKTVPAEKEDAINAVADGIIDIGGACVSTGFADGVFTLKKSDTAGKQGLFINGSGSEIADAGGLFATPTGKLSRAKVDSVTIGDSYGVDASGDMVNGGTGFICVGDAGNDEAHLMSVGNADTYLCLNASGAIIPTYGVGKISAIDANGIRSIVKPTVDSETELMFSPKSGVPVGGYFYGTPPFDGLGAVTGTPAIGDEIGAVSGSWLMATGQTGFKCNGAVGGAARIRPFRSSLVTMLRVTRADALSAELRGTSTVSPEYINGVWEDFSETVDPVGVLGTGSISLISTYKLESSLHMLFKSVANVPTATTPWGVLWVELLGTSGGVYRSNGSFSSHNARTVQPSNDFNGQWVSCAFAFSFSSVDDTIESWRFRLQNYTDGVPHLSYLITLSNPNLGQFAFIQT